MSVLALPRFVFQGHTSWNPNTVNNSPVSYDETKVAPQFHPQGYPAGQPPPIEASNYDTWLKTYDNGLPGSWNVYGDQGCNFVQAKVTAVRLAGAMGKDAPDPLQGKPVQILGQSGQPPARMVDVDPYSPYTTQIFYQGIVIGDLTVGVTGPGVVRMFSRWPNMARNLGGLPIAGNMGVTWQATVAADQLTWYGVDQSPALAALQAAIAQGGQGLALRFVSYGTLYFTQATWNGQPITDLQQLSAAYLAGFHGPNPAVSAALGTIGVWGPGELASAPTERVLTPGDGLIPPNAAAGVRPAALTRAAQEAVFAAAPPTVPTVPTVPIGTAFARVDSSRRVVTLDFLGTFPEQDATLAKADFGAFELQAVPDQGQPVAIGQPLTSAGYAQAAYDAGGGIVDFSFTPDQEGLVTTGRLQLVQTGSNAVALHEATLLAETDQRGVYVDEGQTQQVTIQVYQQGVTPPASAVELRLYTYNEGPSLVPVGQSLLELLDALGNPLPEPPVLPVGPDGSATFGVTPRRPGIATVVFLPYLAGANPPPPPNLGKLQQIPDSYVVVRALPFDNALFDMQPSEITWNFVYRHVLQTFNLVYPLMSLILNLGSETTVNQNAQAIEERTSLERFLTTSFMPITREMSAGKRYVLRQYLSNLPPP
ncbi:MAG TPA: hypothetical protein VOA87_05925 [Thermoanaerobaculia bacterium]|nr:hypothetical protein [Thermoanaerobaculia bacterium]